MVVTNHLDPPPQSTHPHTLHTADQPPSLGALLGETLRVAFASILLDYSQVRHKHTNINIDININTPRAQRVYVHTPSHLPTYLSLYTKSSCPS